MIEHLSTQTPAPAKLGPPDTGNLAKPRQEHSSFFERRQHTTAALICSLLSLWENGYTHRIYQQTPVKPCEWIPLLPNLTETRDSIV